MNPSFRSLALAAACAAALVQPSVHAADKFPSKPVKIVVPYAPGGPNDIVARLLAARLGEMEGQAFIVENRPGGGSNVGAEFVARAPADGYTLLIVATSHAINMSLFPKAQLHYDLLTDLAPVSMIMTGPLLLVTRPDFPANNLKELVAAAKAKPGQLSFASSGNGSSTHLGGEMLSAAAGINTIHVPYKGSGPGLIDVMSGQTTYMMDTMLSAMPFVTSGKLKALAVTSKKRSPVLPNVPTVAEQGYPNFEAVAFIGMMAPAKTPQPVIDRVNADLQKALAMPDVKDKLAAQGFTAEWSRPADFRHYLEAEIPKWGAIVKSAKVKVE
jgi:tripartite-type tricarboxylate transporter receptor subunit TctC